MAVLINGNGNEAIYAQQDADWFASIMGNQTAITAIGSKFAASLLDANTVGVADGVIITQEGRRIQLDVNEIDSFDIPAGGQGETNYYIIGYHLVTGDLSEQYCETFVRLMDNDTDTIPEDTFRGGADEVFVSLYRVTQDDLVITDMDLLLPEITTVAQLSQHLTAYYNKTTKKWYEINSDGTIGGEIKMGNPSIDYDNYIHVFSATAPADIPASATYGFTFTATRDCYIYGSTIRDIVINGHSYFSATYGGSAFNTNIVIDGLKLTDGDVVAVSNDAPALHVCIEK